MKAKGGIGRLIEQAQDRLGAEILARHDHSVKRFGSPIEALFFHSVRVGIYLNDGGDMLSLQPLINNEQWRDLHLEYAILYPGEQVRCLDWPVDFLYVVRDYAGGKNAAVVECDGHDFHERTKEQARRDRSRDRRLQDAGYRVFRFTGSEIYRDPLGCADEVSKWAEDCWQIGLPE